MSEKLRRIFEAARYLGLVTLGTIDDKDVKTVTVEVDGYVFTIDRNGWVSF